MDVIPLLLNWLDSDHLALRVDDTVHDHLLDLLEDNNSRHLPHHLNALSIKHLLYHFKVFNSDLRILGLSNLTHHIHLLVIISPVQHHPRLLHDFNKSFHHIQATNSLPSSESTKYHVNSDIMDHLNLSLYRSVLIQPDRSSGCEFCELKGKRLYR